MLHSGRRRPALIPPSAQQQLQRSDRPKFDSVRCIPSRHSHVEYTWNMSDCAMWNTSGKQVECANTFHLFISRVFNVLMPAIIHVYEPRVYHVLMTPIIHENKPPVFYLLMPPILHVNKPHVFQVLMPPIIHVNKPLVLHWCKSGIINN